MMAVPNLPLLGGHPVDLQNVLEALENELGQMPGDLLCKAIRRGDEAAIHEHSLLLQGQSTLAPKRLAMQLGRLDVLRLLLEQDNLIEEDLVAAACELKDRATVRMLLESGWPVDHTVGYDASILCLAVDDVEFMQWLISNGADVNARSMLNESALSKATACGSMDTVRLLLAEGTEIQHGDLLHCAAQRRSQLEGAILIKDLVQLGADVDAYRFNNPTAFRWRAPFKLPTPLHVACQEANVPVAQALLQHGADPHRKMLEAGKETGQTAFEIALESHEQELVTLLTKSDSRSLIDVRGML